jgi:hypothetical protein
MPTRVKGAVNLRKALRQFTPDLAKETTKEIGNFLKPVVRTARGYMPAESPLSGWAPRSFNEGKFPTYNGAIAKRGVKYKTSPSKTNRRGFKALVSILNTSAAGAIYETAGRKTSGGRFSPKLGGELTGPSQKMRGRVIFKAWNEDQGKAQGAVIKAIATSADKLNKRATVSGG